MLKDGQIYAKTYIVWQCLSISKRYKTGKSELLTVQSVHTKYQIFKKQKMLSLSIIFGLFYLIVLAEGDYDSKHPNLIEYIDVTNCKSGKQELDIVPGASLTFYYRLLSFKYVVLVFHHFCLWYIICRFGK